MEEETINQSLMKGVSAIEDEVKALGDSVVSEQLYYILLKKASERRFPNGIIHMFTFTLIYFKQLETKGTKAWSSRTLSTIRTQRLQS